MEKGPGSKDETESKRIRVRDRRRPPPEQTDEEPGPSGADSESAPERDPQEQVRRAREEAAAYLEDLQRLKAEFENYRKRILKEQTALVERASAGLVKRLLGVLDNFELAVAAAEATRDFDRMLRGVEMVFGELKEVLAAEGLDVIEAKGRPFDPNLHEAALEVPGTVSGEPQVTEVLRPGYTLRGRVLRPAMVKVTRPGPAEEPATPSASEEGSEATEEASASPREERPAET